MPIVLQSPNAYTGIATLRDVAEVSRSAADVYAIYAARVAALAGGAITDPTYALNRITQAIASGELYRSSIIISPRMGIVLSGSNITRFVNVAGPIDGVVTGVMEKDTTHSAWATAKFNSSTADLITFTGVSINRTGKFGFTGSSSTHSVVNHGIYASFTPVAQPWVMGDYDANVTVNAVNMIDSDIFIPDNGASGVLVEQNGTGGKFSIYIDGILREISTQTFTNLTAGVTGTYVLKSIANTDTWFNEWCHMDAATEQTFANQNLNLANNY